MGFQDFHDFRYSGMKLYDLNVFHCSHMIFNDFYNFAEMQSPLGNASAEDCANYTVSLFSDLTRMVTMQNLFHDGGYSSTGVSQEQLNAM